MRERTQAPTRSAQSSQVTLPAEQVFLREWVQPEAQKRKMGSQQGYFCHSEPGVQVVKRMLERKLGRYQNETKQKHEVIYARTLRKRIRNEAKRFANVSYEKGQREEQRKNGRC